MERYAEWIISALGGLLGWFVGVFEPSFPLIYVAIAFIMYDSWTAYELDKRVKSRYPDRKKRPAKYVSFKAWGMIPTMTESFVVILMMYAAQKYVFVDLYVPLSYIATGAICGVQLLSIAENKSSCRFPGERGYKVWKVLAKVLIDKTERHFDTDLSELREDFDKETNLEY
jgi:hypothetical protein